MSIWTTLLRAGREMTVLTERVDRLREELDARSGELTNIRERVIRIETLIDIAWQRKATSGARDFDRQIDHD